MNAFGLQNTPLARVVLVQGFEREFALLDEIARFFEGNDQASLRAEKFRPWGRAVGDLAGLGLGHGLDGLRAQ